MRTLKLKQKFQGNYLLTVRMKKRKEKKNDKQTRATTNYGWGYAMAT